MERIKVYECKRKCTGMLFIINHKVHPLRFAHLSRIPISSASSLSKYSFLSLAFLFFALVVFFFAPVVVDSPAILTPGSFSDEPNSSVPFSLLSSAMLSVTFFRDFSTTFSSD
ncbi:hypothetical protein X975_25261, partial [Stegodyphus mimosarum]